MASTLIADQKGERHQTLLIVEDITERKRAEEWKADFIRAVAHDIANPLSAVRAALELYSYRKLGDPTAEGYLETARLNIERIANLISNLSFSVDLALNREKERSPIKLDALLARIHKALVPLFQRKGVEFNLKIDNGEIQVLANENLERAIGNILDNALKFTPEGGRVEVSLRKEGEKALITISDTGTGISRHDLPHIFERFYKGESAHTGTGLGLYTVKLTIEEHGGEISVESEPGKGSKFSISLPLLLKSSG